MADTVIYIQLMQLFDNAQMDGTMGHSREPIILTNRYMTEGITAKVVSKVIKEQVWNSQLDSYIKVT